MIQSQTTKKSDSKKNPANLWDSKPFRHSIFATLNKFESNIENMKSTILVPTILNDIMIKVEPKKEESLDNSRADGNNNSETDDEVSLRHLYNVICETKVDVYGRPRKEFYNKDWLEKRTLVEDFVLNEPIDEKIARFRLHLDEMKKLMKELGQLANFCVARYEHQVFNVLPKKVSSDGTFAEDFEDLKWSEAAVPPEDLMGVSEFYGRNFNKKKTA